MQKAVDAIISENKSAAIKKRAILHTFFTIRDITDMPNTFNKQLTMTVNLFCGFSQSF